AGCGHLGPGDPNPTNCAGPAGGRRGGRAGARHTVFPNTAGGPAKFAAGVTRKRR
ncbi:hypothetical protein P7K49_032208, partial [Saguinus oedipus]